MIDTRLAPILLEAWPEPATSRVRQGRSLEVRGTHQTRSSPHRAVLFLAILVPTRTAAAQVVETNRTAFLVG